MSTRIALLSSLLLSIVACGQEQRAEPDARLLSQRDAQVDRDTGMDSTTDDAPTAAPADAGVVADLAPDGPKALSCFGLLECVDDCSGGAACIQACHDVATPRTVTIAEAAVLCVSRARQESCQQPCADTADPDPCNACYQQVCGAELTACANDE